MSRTPFSSRRPPRRGTYRPQLEALEDRLAPGSLLGVDTDSWIDPGNLGAACPHKAAVLTDRAGIVASFRPQLEALEVRLASGSLLGVDTGPGIDPGNLGAACPHETAELTDLAGIIARQQQAAFHVSYSPVVDFDDPTIVLGDSFLVREDRSVTIVGWTYGLEPGAYTAWMAVFNPGVTTPTVGWVGGLVVGPSGFTGFGAHVTEGEVLLGHPTFSGGSLQDAQGAEIRLVLRSHGPVDPERLFEQTHTFEPDVAVDVRRTIHLPPPAP